MVSVERFYRETRYNQGLPDSQWLASEWTSEIVERIFDEYREIVLDLIDDEINDEEIDDEEF